MVITKPTVYQAEVTKEQFHALTPILNEMVKRDKDQGGHLVALAASILNAIHDLEDAS